MKVKQSDRVLCSLQMCDKEQDGTQLPYSTEEQALWLTGPPTERSKPEGKWFKPVLWLGAGRQVQKIRWGSGLT